MTAVSALSRGAAANRRLPISVEWVRGLFDLDPERGLLFWKRRRRGVSIGDIAGSPSKDGYLRTSIDGRWYTVHRLIFVHHHGYDPASDLDHVNRVRSDNRICNLREATPAQNQANKPGHGRSGIRGVRWRPDSSKWQASLRVDGKLLHLGMFKTSDEARAAYVHAARQVNGDFVRVL